MQEHQVADRFWRKVDKNGPIVRPELGPCWIWMSTRCAGGRYGSFRIGTTMRLAHRMAWAIARSEPGTSFVLHKCDNTHCVNPDHLFLGTQSENMADMHSKGRAVNPRGEAHSQAKLTESEVRSIRELHVPGYAGRGTPGGNHALAKRFGVTPDAIRRIVSGETWRHLVPGE